MKPMDMMQQSRKDKIALLKGVLEGTRSLKELLPQECYIVMSYENRHEVMHYKTKEVIIMNDEEYGAWYERYKSTWIKNSPHVYLTQIM